MILTRRDFLHLRPSLALFVSLSAIGSGVAWATVRAASANEAAYRTALAQRDDVGARLARVDAESADIRRKLTRYRELMASEGGGKENRAIWLQRISEAKTQRRIAALRYELSPRRPFEFAPGVGAHEFTTSTMKLQMQLPHEGSLLGFLDDLMRDVHALVHVRSCDVGRREGQLDAECTIDWVTLRGLS